MALGVDFGIAREPTTVLNRSFPEALVNGRDDGTGTRGLSPFHAWGLFIPFQYDQYDRLIAVPSQFCFDERMRGKTEGELAWRCNKWLDIKISE